VRCATVRRYLGIASHFSSVLDCCFLRERAAISEQMEALQQNVEELKISTESATENRDGNDTGEVATLKEEICKLKANIEEQSVQSTANEGTRSRFVIKKSRRSIPAHWFPVVFRCGSCHCSHRRK
jgi:hypothetical protein